MKILETMMPDSETIETQLNHHLGRAVPANAAYDINAALELSELLEDKGFSFRLKDLCPKSLTETLWRAVFSKNNREFSAEDQKSSMAVCMAALEALAGQ